jgi:hypothetical protein
VEFNRNHYFMAGLVIVALGIQLRLVDSYVLNEQATRVVAKVMKAAPHSESSQGNFLMPNLAPARHVVHVPKALGWALLSVGGVLVLHSLAMPKPGG